MEIVRIITNNFLRRIINNIYSNIVKLFSDLSFKEKGAFLAGFFDAEGNVNKLDKNLRFSQKIKDKVEAIMTILKKEDYHLRYDKSNIIIGFRKEYSEDLNLFKKQIMPFMKHLDKRKEVTDLLKGYYVKDSYKSLVKVINNNPGCVHNDIAKVLNRRKVRSKLTALTEARYIMRERKKIDEPYKYYITKNGLSWLGGKDKK